MADGREPQYDPYIPSGQPGAGGATAAPQQGNQRTAALQAVSHSFIPIWERAGSSSGSWISSTVDSDAILPVINPHHEKNTNHIGIADLPTSEALYTEERDMAMLFVQHDVFALSLSLRQIGFRIPHVRRSGT
jgi:hypothetical protein